MSDPFLAQITMFGFNFAPQGWALCQGQLLPISQYTALFSLLGTTYGGNGTTNFALPDLRDQTVIGMGAGHALTQRLLGESGGSSSVALLQSENAIHNHFVEATTDRGNMTASTGNVLATGGAGTPLRPTTAKHYSTNPPNTQLNPLALGVSGQGLPHNNMQPYLTLNFCIAMQGVFPPRS
jgi:microcystin-dependent protein